MYLSIHLLLNLGYFTKYQTVLMTVLFQGQTKILQGQADINSNGTDVITTKYHDFIPS